jgi:hypothetical protein
MAFDPNLLVKVLDVGFSGTGRSVWIYGGSTRTTNSSSEVAAVGFFTKTGVGSRGTNAVGLKLGDIVINNSATGTTFSTTGRVTLHNVINSTANVASTSASSAMLESFGYDCTISAGSTF